MYHITHSYLSVCAFLFYSFFFLLFFFFSFRFFFFFFSFRFCFVLMHIYVCDMYVCLCVCVCVLDDSGTFTSDSGGRDMVAYNYIAAESQFVINGGRTY